MTGAVRGGGSGVMFNLEFCGENRREQLERLKTAYCEIAEALERLEPGKATEPIHRVVLIHAERGLGKTRLAMELYRWLSTECDPGDYWPDELELREPITVMPPAALWKDRLEKISSPPPFLWWGLQVFDSPNSTNTVFDGLHNLLPHLTALHPESSSRLAAAIGESLREVGIELTMALVEQLTFAGTFKAGVHGAFKIFRVLKPALADDNEQISSVIDSTLEDLGAIFAPISRTFAKAPLVLFVDDAQYADRDVTMAAFLEKLIFLSSEHDWPLLLIITHWTRELTVGATTGESSRVAQVLHHARFGQEERGKFANQPGGVLKEAHYVEIDLGNPVEDLTPALRNLFPGLDGRVVEEIVGKSGGNPRKLEQIARYMGRKPAWFIDGSTDNDLTETGREKVLELSDLPIDEVVLERLREMPPSARRAVSLASMAGPRFVVDLVDRLAETHFGEPARGGLEESETTYRYVREVVDRSRDDIAAFAERLFLEAAEEYRTSGLAGNELGGWPGDKKLYEILDGLLDRLLDEPDTFTSLGAADRAEALNLAVARMERDRPVRAGLALCHLVGIEKERSNFEGSYEAADRFLAGLRNGIWTLDETPFKLADGVGQALVSLGRSSDADWIYSALLRQSETRAGLDPANTDWQHDLAVSHANIGDLLAARGDTDEALAAYGKSLEIMERLAGLDPANTDWQRDLAVSHARIGGLLAARGDTDGALAAYGKALEIMERLTGLDPSDTDWQHGLGVSHSKIGDLLAARGDTDEALAAYGKSLEIMERLVGLDPANTDWQHRLGASYSRIGDLLAARGDAEEALAAYGKDLEISERLAGLDPANTGWQRDLGASYSRIGDLLAARGDAEEALAAYGKDLEISERLAGLDPANTDWQRDLGVSHAKLGDLLAARGDTDGALAAYGKALEIMERLAGLDPSNTDWQHDLAVSHSRIGDLLAARGDIDGALAAYGKALEISEPLVRLDPGNTEWQHELATSRAKVDRLRE